MVQWKRVGGVLLPVLGASAIVGCANDPGLAVEMAAIGNPDGVDIAEPYVFPAVANIDDDCTGTLISPSHILTASHCVLRHAGSEFELRVPTTVSFAGQSIGAPFPTQFSVVAAEHAPISTDFFGSIVASSDYAILTLSSVVPHHAGSTGFGVRPMPLAPVGPAPDGDLTAVGFSGSRRGYRASTAAADGLLWTQIPGFLQRGDSGGPLLVSSGGAAMVVGIAVSREVGEPDLWVSTVSAPVREWIDRVVDANEDGRPDVYCPGRERGSDMSAAPENDADGDYVRDDRDTCPGVFNPCQVGLDSDGDGLDDDCEACPQLVGSTIRRGDPTESDLDGDGIPDVCDCHPGIPSPPRDVDGDFIDDQCDNCREVPNTDQGRCDPASTAGDACRPIVDADDDGVDDTCVGRDNCLGVRNPGQENCNLDAERALGLPEAGDACDPTPCGETSLELGTTPGPTTVSSYVRLNDVRVDARATVSIEGRTGFRFCPCAMASGDDLESRIACGVPDFGCSVADSGDYLGVEQATGWRSATTRFATEGGGVPLAIVGTGARAEGIARYRAPAPGPLAFETDLRAQWRMREDDEPRWVMDFLGEQPSGLTRPGVLWTHTPGTRTVTFSEEQANPASHYWSGVVAPDAFSLRLSRLRFLRLPPFPRACWVCQGAFPLPFLARDTSLATGSPLVVALPAGAISATPFFQGAPPELTSGVWVAAAEPPERLAPTGLRMVAIDPLTARVSAAVEEGVGGTFVSRGACDPQYGVCPPPDGPNGPVGGSGDVVPVEALPAAYDLAALGAVDDARFVLSATEHTLFTLAGGAVTQLDLNTGTQRTLPLPRPLGEVLAATYSAADGAIVAVEAAVVGRLRIPVRRLVSIDATSGAVETLGEWPRLPGALAATRFALTAANDGTVWLVTSRERGAHLVAWLDLHARDARGRDVGLRVRALTGGAGPVLEARASRMGLSLAVVQGEGTASVGYRAASMRTAGTLAGLAACF